MKFTWFHLMPWPHLAEDFRSKHRSVWVDLPNSVFDPARGHEVYNEYLDELEYAETLGFDGLGCNEHHSNGYGLMPSPNLIGAALARRTSKAAIVVLGNSIALYNPPIRVAEEFAMLDCMSGGRLVAGFPVGTSMDTNYVYGTIPALTREKYAEAHDLIIKAWTEKEPFAFNGRYTKLRYVNCWPKPVQSPRPPVFIPGGGSVETYDFCLEHDYNYSYLSYTGYLRAKLLMDGYWDRVAKRGKDDSPFRAGFAQVICVGETDAEAEKLYAEHVSYFYNRCLHVYPGFADAPGYRTVKTIKAGALSQMTRSATEAIGYMSWKELIDDRYIIAGGPETVRQQMEELIKTLRVGHIFCLMQIGNMPADKTRHSSRLFAEKVMPHLRDIWGKDSHDDRFWIHPLEKRAVPAPLPAAAQSVRQAMVAE
jgi:alkanesulfonate monooxygenase SsuD/methylene tetrahydromethanopterin reductase-like flavin-dependent oxidoreductase (luciferase family)